MPVRNGPIEPGDRDTLVTVQQLTESTGASGFPVETWTALDDMWVAKLDAGGQERFRAGQLSGPAVARWQLSYRADMDPDLVDVVKRRRILYAGRAYDVVAAANIGRAEGVELTTLVSSKVPA